MPQNGRVMKKLMKKTKYNIALLVLKDRDNPTELQEETKELSKVYLKTDIVSKKNTRRCDNCNIDIHRSSFAKHLGIKKHLEIEKQLEMILPEWLF